MKCFSSSTRYAWVFLAPVFFLIGPRVAAAQLTTLRVGTNSPASAESAAEQAHLVTQIRAREDVPPNLVEKILCENSRKFYRI
jgi:hypothetical protein